MYYMFGVTPNKNVTARVLARREGIIAWSYMPVLTGPGNPKVSQAVSAIVVLCANWRVAEMITLFISTNNIIAEFPPSQGENSLFIFSDGTSRKFCLPSKIGILNMGPKSMI